MAITLPVLLADSALGLVAQGRAEAPSQPVQWVAVTELEDPRPFLNGAEVVLTTGVRLKTGTAQRSFVQRAHEAGALAIGFGVDLTHRRVPTALVAEADRVGLPVFSVPYEVPFIAIGKKVADALSAAQYAGLEELLEGHAVLASALLGAGGLSSLLGELARMLGTDVALHQYGTRIAGAEAPRSSGGPRLDGEASPGSPDAASGPTAGWHRVPIATGLKDRCTLAIAEPYTRAAVVDYAQSLISVELTNQARNRTGTRTATGQLLLDVVRGTLAGPEAAARLVSSGIDTTVRHGVVIIDVASGQRRALRTLPLPHGWAPASAGLVEDRLVLVAAASLAAEPADLAGYLHGAGLTARIGVGGAYAQPNGVRWSYFEAREALQRGQSINLADRLSLTSLLMSSADVPLADLAAETLRPLERFDAAHGTDLLTTLQRYLDLDGSVAAVAADLSLHRNTIRYRLQQVITLTGYDPSVTSDRVHLYLALRVRALG
ncbi:PucR family transcriptional regulator [Arthrobacter agilis]|uniref:PucR family transcriptional regulator n=1 Tax=Arthrobacter agilis TaxID=37921 RepID=UPI000B362431|nr:PucR family transcriptional regulator ligand-binding domain-containing protein [Arthrobacter agilis]OUM43217.1 PucR family transcriptional regulator [Arthrobacter agilis]PPB46124.1 PucR family transcriptional regulator [Arthrobacter agilis]TPV25412.1 PucR family transcriptional regulator [Arthrobacter agilis]